MIVKLVAANMMLSMLNIIRMNCDVDCDVHCHGNGGEIIAVKKRLSQPRMRQSHKLGKKLNLKLHIKMIFKNTFVYTLMKSVERKRILQDFKS